MSLRDYFAAKAMNGYMSGGMVPEGADALKPVILTAEIIAQRAYQYADAMLAERNRAR